MKVLLSIKPEYVDKIFSGEKRYEYRKSMFKNKNIDKCDTCRKTCKK